MKLNIILCLTIFFIISVGTVFCQDSGFGFGVIVGEPTGITLKNWLTPTTAIDAGLAWSFVKESSFHLHADYLFHSYDVFKTEEKIPLYCGIGGRIKTGRNEDSHVGFRMVVGVGYFFKNAPFDIFLEVAPILDLVPATKLRGNGGFGARYFIKYFNKL